VGETMKESFLFLSSFVGSNMILAPILFIFLHLIRQFIFIPVAVICIAGGLLFGSIPGTLYSLIGLTGASILFFCFISKVPAMSDKLFGIKQKWLGKRAKLTVGQITILRLVPFIHYQLLNVCLLERCPTLGGFTKGSIKTNLPLAFFYTVFGQYITRFTPAISLIILLGLSVLFFIFREKAAIMKWREFFPDAEKSKG
jgi:uncharacterized membrane protein YdjX (TVP38/TMEM64 family)